MKKTGEKRKVVPRRACVHAWVQPQPGKPPEAGGCGEPEPAPSRKGHATKRAAGAPSLGILEEQCKDQLLPAADLKFVCI